MALFDDLARIAGDERSTFDRRESALRPENQREGVSFTKSGRGGLCPPYEIQFWSTQNCAPYSEGSDIRPRGR